MEGRKIKILYLIDYLHGFGGTERHLFYLATKLNKMGFECTVCALRYHHEIVDHFKNKGIHVITAPVVRIYDFDGLKQILSLVKFVKSENIDIIQSFNVDSDIVASLVSRLSGKSVVVSSRRDLGGYRKKRHHVFIKLFCRNIQNYLAVCDAVASDMITRESVNPDRITTIYNGIELNGWSENEVDLQSLRDKYQLSAKTFLIGNVSHLRPEKGHPDFIKAISYLKDKIADMKIFIIGGGGNPALRESYEKLAWELGLSDKIIFTGYQKDIQTWLSLLNVCCLTPIRNEGFSNALLEQMLLGKAIIATDVGGNKEALIHSVSGVIVPPGDSQAIADAIFQLYQDKGLRAKLEAAAKKRVTTEFSMNKMINAMENYYSKILAISNFN